LTIPCACVKAAGDVFIVFFQLSAARGSIHLRIVTEFD
jgi:hypothetical protein